MEGNIMPTDIVMPQMGESIFEGTITKWLKKPGDKGERDEPLFEISTDKVDPDIPSPSAGGRPRPLPNPPLPHLPPRPLFPPPLLQPLPAPPSAFTPRLSFAASPR